MDIRSHLEREIELLRRKDNKFKVPTERLILMAANNEPKLVNEIRYHMYDDFRKEVNRLVEMNIITPIGKYRADILSYTDFWILPKGKVEYDMDLYNHVLNQYTQFDMSFYRLKYTEFKEDKAYIDILHNYILKEKKERLTMKELAYCLFKDEQAFLNVDENSEYKSKSGRGSIVLKRLNLSLELFNAYEVIEPFSSYVKSEFYSKKVRKILIIENRDSYYTMAFHSKKWNEFDMFILGDEHKIISSFSLAKYHNIYQTDEIYYFGDIDLSGFYNFAMLLNEYSGYNIKLYVEGYELLTSFYDEKILLSSKSVNHFMKMDVISNVIHTQFKQELENKIMNVLLNKKYIPQEAIRFSYSEE